MRILVATAAVAVVASPALAGSASGNGWTATSEIVGQTSTGTVPAGGGNPIYIPPKPQYSNVVGLRMDYGAAGAFVCSGTLVGNNRIVTAAHCVSDGTKARPLTTTAFFFGGSTDEIVYSSPLATRIDVASINVNKAYTGEVIDENDIAVLRLAAPAPSFATAAKLSTLTDLTGVEHIVAGYGARSINGGTLGTLPEAVAGTGRLRYAGNRFEARIGDPDFNGQWAADLGGGEAKIDNVWMSDFDNGTAFRDQMCNVAASFGLSGDKFCNTGIGAFEGIGAGGDSGGAYFVNGELAAVHSFALWYREDESANRFGQFKGAVGIANQRAFLASAIPEPATWAMMIVGFGLVGSAARRRRPATVAA